MSSKILNHDGLFSVCTSLMLNEIPFTCTMSITHLSRRGQSLQFQLYHMMLY